MAARDSAARDFQGEQIWPLEVRDFVELTPFYGQ